MRSHPAPTLRVLNGGRETARNTPQPPPAVGVAILLAVVSLAAYTIAAIILL